MIQRYPREDRTRTNKAVVFDHRQKNYELTRSLPVIILSMSQ